MRQMLRLRKWHWERQQMRPMQPLSIVTNGLEPAAAPAATAIIIRRRLTRDEGRTTAPAAAPATTAIIMTLRTPIQAIQAHMTAPTRMQAVSTTSTITTRVVRTEDGEEEEEAEACAPTVKSRRSAASLLRTV